MHEIYLALLINLLWFVAGFLVARSRYTRQDDNEDANA